MPLGSSPMPGLVASAGEQRKPLIWSNEADFDLTALIDSVEKDIQRLDQMENQTLKRRQSLSRSHFPEHNWPQALETHGEWPLTEEILSLPGYKPKQGRLPSPIGSALSDIASTSTPLGNDNMKPSRIAFLQKNLEPIPPALPPKKHKPVVSRAPDPNSSPSSKLSLLSSLPLGSEDIIQPPPDLNLIHQRLLPKHNCVTNIIYSRRLPSPPIFRKTADNHTIVVSPRSQDDLATIQLASHLTNHQGSRKLFCPLCTQTFGHTFGLECHLLSVHFRELQEFKKTRNAIPTLRKCPECKAQFLKINTIIRHLVYHHSDYVMEQILNIAPITTDYHQPVSPSRYVRCRFCHQQFLHRHQKLLMMHLEQKHVHDLEIILTPHLTLPTSSTPPTRDHGLEVQLMMSSPSRMPRLPHESMAKDHQFVRGWTGNTPRDDVRRSLHFSVPETRHHHYYDVIETTPIKLPRNEDLRSGDEGKKRERSNEEECHGIDRDALNNPLGAKHRDKPVKKRVKRIDNKISEKRRSQELQDLLRIDTENSPPCEFVPLSRVTSYIKRNKRHLSGSSEKDTPDMATPANIRAGRSFRRPIDHRAPPRLMSALSETCKTTVPPEPMSMEQSEAALRVMSIAATLPKSVSNIKKKLFKCNLCEVAFLENAFLLSHLKNKHRSTMTKALRPQYSCAACPARFFKNSFLVKHVESHQFQHMT
eukprot:maker-scaffold510_size151595-snap-gene-0.40 protein:Tk04760 transcript:maker-scaffold510_size151595-snap-gene-0.40-mRNA-1 annotation:"hypothetical protein Phum_PHUM540530"